MPTKKIMDKLKLINSFKILEDQKPYFVIINQKQNN